MNWTDLLERWEKRKSEAQAQSALAPVAKIMEQVLEEARMVDGVPELEKMIGTADMAKLMGVTAKTARKRCAAGLIEDARKPAGSSKSDEWKAPLSSVLAFNTGKRRRKTGPRLWVPDAKAS